MAHFITTRRVEFYETDLAGIVHFSNFYRWMEFAEHELFRSLGLKIVDATAEGVPMGWPRVSATCDFHAPVRYDEVVRMEVTIVRRGPRSLTTRYELFRDDVHLATGEMKTVCCVHVAGEPLRSIDIPANYAAALDRIAAAESP